MKLIVMGAGYVGMELLRHLQNSDNIIYATTTQQEKVAVLENYASHVTLIPPDDDRPLLELINTCDAMVVLIAPKNGSTYEETYLKMAQKISNALRGRSKPFYLLYTSSTSVYEGVTHEWATEDLPLSPTSENGKILLAAENLYLKHPETCILRLGGIFGPGRDLKKRALALSGKPYPGNGDDPTNHIHLQDIISGIQFCLSHRLTGIFNLVNDDHPTRKELYTRLCEELSIPPPVWSENTLYGKKGYKVSNEKITNLSVVPAGENNVLQICLKRFYHRGTEEAPTYE